MSEHVRVETRQGVLDITVKLTVTDCAACAVIFAVPDRLIAERREDGKAFYCPNGHTLVFGGEIDKLRKALHQAERDRDWYKDAEHREREWKQTAERRLAATKGAVTKLRKRLVAGTCPFGCRRHFADLERHVATRHPGSQLEAEQADEA